MGFSGDLDRHQGALLLLLAVIESLCESYLDKVMQRKSQFNKKKEMPNSVTFFFFPLCLLILYEAQRQSLILSCI